MSDEYIINGKDFKQALKKAKEMYSSDECLKLKNEYNYGTYIGFSTLKFGKNSFIIYSMKFVFNNLNIHNDKISGKFIHTISDVILDISDSGKQEYINYADNNIANINKICEEYFEGYWFPKENRILIYGTELKFPDGEIAIGKENYDIYINERYIIGKWAFRKAPRNGKTTPDMCLGDTDVFTEYIYMFNIEESLLCFPLHVFKKNIFKYISILKNNNHSKSIKGNEWTQSDITSLLNNYNDINNKFSLLKDYLQDKYCINNNDIINIPYDDFNKLNIKNKISINDLIYFNNNFFIPINNEELGSSWTKISENEIFIGKNLTRTDMSFTLYLNSILNNTTNNILDISFSEKKWNEFNIDNLRKYDYICINKNNEIVYLKPKIKEQDIVITIDINSVTNIKQIEQKFECVLRVKIEWLPSIEDLYFILSHGIDKYVPSWFPLDLIFLNKYDIKSEKKVGPFLTKSNGKYKNVYYYYYNISFIDKVELNNFPFDIQDLEIEMELPKSDNYNVNWIINKNNGIVNQLSEWQYKDVQHSSHNNINKKYKRIIHIYVKRNFWVYVWRIMVVMSLISCVSLFNISIDPIENLGDRISYSVTLFLTSIAYSIVTSSYLPILGNQTLMDWYIFHVYIYLGSNMGIISLLPYYNPNFIKVYDVCIHYTYFIIWIIWHILFIIRVKYYILPSENKKLLQNKIIELYCDYCGISGLEWIIVDNILPDDIPYDNILLKNEIHKIYDKTKYNKIILKEAQYYKLTNNYPPITRNSYIKIDYNGYNLIFKPICGTKNQVSANIDKHKCYVCDNDIIQQYNEKPNKKFSIDCYIGYR
jgi:hypothetical protein